MSRKRKKKSAPGLKKKKAVRKAGKPARDRIEKLMQSALAHHQRKDYQTALGLYRQILSMQPVNTMALNNMGLIRKSLGEPRVAEEILRMAVNLEPENPDFHYNLGNTMKDDGRFPAALTEYQIALKLKPDYFSALLNLGDCYRILADFENAKKAFDQAVQLQPDDTNVRLNQANLYMEMGNGEKAVEMYEELIKETPTDVRLYSNCGTAYKQIGKLKEAAKCYRKAVEIEPRTIGAIYNAVNIEKTKPDDPWFELLNNLKQNPQIAVYEKAGLYFALGKMYDDIKEYDEAFINYRDGNALRTQQAARLNRRFVPEKYRQSVDEIIKAYSPVQLKKIRHTGVLGKDESTPILIVGMPRSGTTLTEQILASHPKVNGAGELTDLVDLSILIDNKNNQNERLPYPQNIEFLDEQREIELASRYIARLRELCGDAEYIVDKMPGNFSYLGFFARLFPGAKVIDCRRNPIDNCLSCYIQNFSRRHEYSNDLDHLVFVYKEYLRMMDYWNKYLPIPIYQSHYENLVEDHEQSIRKLLEFCDLEWDDSVLEFYKVNRNIQTASVVQVRQPLYKTAIKRWENYKKYITPLIKAFDTQSSD